MRSPPEIDHFPISVLSPLTAQQFATDYNALFIKKKKTTTLYV